MNAMFSALLRRSHAPIQGPHFSPYPHQPPPYAHGALIKSLIRETCTGREWQLREVISRVYTLVSSSLNPGIRASQSSKHASKQASAQSVSQLFASFSFHGPAPRSPLRGSPNSIHVHDHFQNSHHSRQDARTKSSGHLSITILYSERVLRARDEISPDPVPPDVQRDET